MTEMKGATTKARFTSHVVPPVGQWSALALTLHARTERAKRPRTMKIVDQEDGLGGTAGVLPKEPDLPDLI
jgi:hypothetical protein